MRIVALVPDLMDSSKVRGAFPEAVFVRNAEELAAAPADVVLVDLSTPGAAGAAATHKATSIGFISHVDEEAAAQAEELGVNHVLPRSLFFRRLAQGDLM